MKTKLHHCAVKIRRGNLEKVIEVFKLLGCKVAYQPEGQTWAMIAQEGIDFNIQLVEYDEVPIADIEVKQGSHIAFISDNPKEIVDQAKTWAAKNNLKFRDGGWTDKELYFDLPEVFINFVVEVMHTSIVES